MGYKGWKELTLRQQIDRLAASTFSKEFTCRASFPQLVRALALEAFTQRWDEDINTRIIRRALQLLEKRGAVSSSEPGLLG